MSDQKILINTRLALKWKIVERHQSAGQLDFNNSPAIQLLEVIESHSNTNSSSSNINQINQSEISRLESKVDLLLLLFTRNQFKHDIGQFDISLSADAIHIKTTGNFKINQLLELELYFNQSCPEPLLFSVTVLPSGKAQSIALSFCNIGKLSQAFLEKFIFKQHRNEIASLKKNV